jgi:uncharacterized protein YuzE
MQTVFDARYQAALEAASQLCEKIAGDSNRFHAQQRLVEDTVCKLEEDGGILRATIAEAESHLKDEDAKIRRTLKDKKRAAVDSAKNALASIRVSTKKDPIYGVLGEL